MSQGHRRTLERLIEILESARQRPAMYFARVDVEHVLPFLDGIWLTLGAAGLEPRDHDCRKPSLERRGIPFTALGHEPVLRERLVSEAKIVDELLLIEIETFRNLCSSLEYWLNPEEHREERSSGDR